MKPRKEKFNWETAGSLVPELEGATRSASHIHRLRPAPAPKTAERGDAAHGGDQH